MYFPISLNLDRQPCLLIGAGELALRKARLLYKSGSILTVVISDKESQHGHEIQHLVNANGGRFLQADLQHSDSAKLLEQLVTDSYLCIVADEMLSRESIGKVAHLCAQFRVPINVVDCPELCTFTFPSIIDRSPLSIAISTGGNAPVLARRLRTRIETLVPTYYADLCQFAGQQRSRVKKQFSDSGLRRRFLPVW